MSRTRRVGTGLAVAASAVAASALLVHPWFGTEQGKPPNAVSPVTVGLRPHAPPSSGSGGAGHQSSQEGGLPPFPDPNQSQEDKGDQEPASNGSLTAKPDVRAVNPMGIGDRNPYPRRVRRELPKDSSAGKFVADSLAELVSLQKNRPTAEEDTRRMELEDLLAETALGVPSALEELIQAGRIGQGKTREIALIVLGRLPAPAAVSFLLNEALVSPDPAVRVQAVNSLAQDRGWNAFADSGGFTRATRGMIADEEIAPALVRAMKRETHSEVLKTLASALWWQLMDGQIEGPDYSRDRAAHPQGMHFAAETLAAFKDVLARSDDPEVRSRVLEQMWYSNSPEAPLIFARTIREGATCEERWTAVDSLAHSPVGGASRWGAVLEALNDRELQVRYTAVTGLAEAGRDEEVLARLLEVYRAKEPFLDNVALESAVRNLISTSDRFKNRTTPSYGRALQLLADAMADNDGAFASACRVIKRIPVAKLSETERAQYDRVKLAADKYLAPRKKSPSQESPSGAPGEAPPGNH